MSQVQEVQTLSHLVIEMALIVGRTAVVVALAVVAAAAVARPVAAAVTRPVVRAAVAIVVVAVVVSLDLVLFVVDPILQVVRAEK